MAKTPKWAEKMKSEPTHAVTFIYGRRTPKSPWGGRGVNIACGALVHAPLPRHMPLTEDPKKVTCPKCRAIIDANGWQFTQAGMCQSCDAYPQEGHKPKCVFVLHFGCTTKPTPWPEKKS